MATQLPPLPQASRSGPAGGLGGAAFAGAGATGRSVTGSRLLNRRRISAATSLNPKRHTLRTVAVDNDFATATIAPIPVAYAEFFRLSSSQNSLGLDFSGDEQLLHLTTHALVKSEAALRQRKFDSAVAARHQLAQAFAMRGAWQAALEQHEHAVAAARFGDSRAVLAECLLELGHCQEKIGEIQNAVGSLRELVQMATADVDPSAAPADDAAPSSEALERLADIAIAGQKSLCRLLLAHIQQLWHEANPNDADVHATVARSFEEALGAARACNDTASQRCVYLRLGDFYQDIAQLDAAIENYSRCLELLSDGTPDGSSQMSACLGLSSCYDQQQQYDMAGQYLERLVELSRHQGSHHMTAETCSRLASLHARLGKFDRALLWNEEALGAATLVQDQPELVNKIKARFAVAQSQAMLVDFKR
ncbi:uncharacterized protein MONBRDRAFT_10431 [Monosiga brevicollis MX1]|uniref:Tetratricopeptide repeat protein 29 n=1 Tax=Monosiga brevicollis TaxID=81824 RepID=A9V670_MONBE|nr:uncharacterized protein MONBRDRAFT_10431 [Monosiga brevicollis MX1]EDQ87020.1 predicted protein [Monosiga brevicollis MX1]|eukprot:XP_001748259.1 hypothetical protein [Monosiga brevicollis MX1]